MARPSSEKKRTRKSKQPLLGERDLYRAIKMNKEAIEYDLTLDQINAVFKAYADILYQSNLNNIRLSLPNIGEFYPQKMKGFEGGMVKIADEPFKKGTTYHEEYVEPKPDYSIIKFEIRKSVKDQFRKDTEEM